MGNHDSKNMDGCGVGRGDAWVVGGVASGDQDADLARCLAQERRCEECRPVPGRSARRREQRKTGWMRAEAAGDPCPWRSNGRSWAAGTGTLMPCAISSAIMSSSTWRMTTLVLVIDETGFLKQGYRRRAEWRGNTPVRRARSRTARCARVHFLCFDVTVMRSSIARYIFQRNGPTIQIAWKRHTCLPMSALRPNQSLQTRMIARAIAASRPIQVGCR